MKQPILSEISRRRKLGLLHKHLPKGSSILEVGAGLGFFADELRDSDYKVTTLDILAPADIVGAVNDWRSLGLEAKSFDAIVALEVIEHNDCLKSLQELCKNDGLIMLSSPHPKFDWVMKVLEFLHLNQKRTSPHSNLTDFKTIPLSPVIMTRPAFVHQVAIFINDGQH